MPINIYPVCWRERADCMPIHCIDAEPEDATEEQLMNFDYKPLSFVCCGKTESSEVPQDIYRVCFKNEAGDEMTDNDMQDLTSLMSVISAAMNWDAVTKVNQGIVEIPAMNSASRSDG